MRRRIVGIADMVVSADPAAVLVTYALGSCLGIAVHDPVTRVGGLLHVMLPDSRIDPQKADASPFMFVDRAVPRLFQEAYRAGAARERLVVKVAGGAAVTGGEDHFRIGERNVLMLRRLLWKNGIPIAAEAVGGSCSRTMELALGGGDVRLKVDRAVVRL